MKLNVECLQKIMSFLSYLSDDLMESSVKIAQLLKRRICHLGKSKTNDLVFIQFDKDGVEHFAFLRIALKENFTHISSDSESPIKVTIKIICRQLRKHQMKLAINCSNHHYLFD